MTAGGLPAVYAVVAHQILASNTYLGLLILFIIGGVTYLWHDAIISDIDLVSKSIPGSLFFYTWKFIGLIVTLFAGLSFLLEWLLNANSHPEGWWVVHLVMLLYGLLISWFTVHPSASAPATRIVPIRPLIIKKNVKLKPKSGSMKTSAA
jgi:hypothetical protein